MLENWAINNAEPWIRREREWRQVTAGSPRSQIPFDCCFHCLIVAFTQCISCLKIWDPLRLIKRNILICWKILFFLHYTTKQQTTNPYWEIIMPWKEILVSMLTLWRLWPWQITARRRRQPANLYLSNKWPSTSTSIPFPWSTSNRRRYFHFYHFAC